MRYFRNILLFFSAIFLLFTGTASAQPIVYRGMEANGAGQPVTGDALGRQLGIRNADVDTYMANEVEWLNPLNNAGVPQGLSVATVSPCNLPSFRRPFGPPWGGTSHVAGMTVFQIDTAQLDPQLVLRAAPLPGQPNHAIIGPNAAMTLANFRALIHATQAQWATTAAPNPPCAPPPPAPSSNEVTKMNNPIHDFTNALAQMGGTQPTPEVELEGHIHAVNAAGHSQAQIMTLMDAVAGALEAADLADKADPIRTLQERIYGAGPRPIRLRP
ncbi:hypothetical protein [Roseovarius sp. EL26]|uniref:hypothetical protein n=1 Tax=Roseovarius sp. EL26 TaxID=2126672 RepID=UPI000EA0B59B|nr:hypothetical protein [Roseovarius sp. EL26]